MDKHQRSHREYTTLETRGAAVELGILSSFSIPKSSHATVRANTSFMYVNK